MVIFTIVDVNVKISKTIAKKVDLYYIYNMLI